MCELVEELSVPVRTGLEQASPLSDPQASGLVIMPSVGEGDELVGYILERLLGGWGHQQHFATLEVRFAQGAIFAGVGFGWRQARTRLEVVAWTRREAKKLMKAVETKVTSIRRSKTIGRFVMVLKTDSFPLHFKIRWFPVRTGVWKHHNGDEGRSFPGLLGQKISFPNRAKDHDPLWTHVGDRSVMFAAISYARKRIDAAANDGHCELLIWAIQKIIPGLATIIPKSRDKIRAAEPMKKWSSHKRNLNRKAWRRRLTVAGQNHGDSAFMWPSDFSTRLLKVLDVAGLYRKWSNQLH
jgi:hypothetical protein